MNKVLLVTSRNSLRTSMRQLLANAEGFGSPLSLTSLTQAKDQIDLGRKFHHVVISSEFSDDECANFIAHVRAGEDPAHKTVFIIVFCGQEQNADKIANRMIAGFHGFLCEPFSLDSVAEMADLSTKVSQQQTLIRMKAATGILLSDVADRPRNQHAAVPVDLLKESQEACAKYNSDAKESITMILSGILIRGELKDRLKGVRSLKERTKSAGEPVRVFFRRLFTNRKDLRPQ